MTRTKFLKYFMMGMIAISFPSCNGIFDGIYDHPVILPPAPETDHANDTLIELQPPYGFISTDASTCSGRLYLDASSHGNWVYVDFTNQKAFSTSISADPDKELLMPEKWDFAIHRYDTKTNGGGACETSFSSLKQLIDSHSLPEGPYVADVADTIIIDNSDMMNGNVVRAATPLNLELSKWMHLDLSEMPPIYTPSNKVYILQTVDGRYAGLRFVDYMNQLYQKGYITIDYIYPLEF